MSRGGNRGGFQSGGRGGFNSRGGAAGGPGGRGDHGGRGGQGGRYGNQGYGRGGRRFGWKDDKPQRMRDASITVKADWQLLEEIEFNRLAKLNLDVGDGDDLESYGFLQYYDRAFDKTSVKLERSLAVVDKVQFNPTASEDPIIQRLSSEKAAQIFVTDNVLSMLLCASRTVYPWDMIITRKGDQLFFDKREGGPFDFLTVNENALEPPLDPEGGVGGGINTPAALSMEATYINSNFALQVVDSSEGGVLQMEHPNPFYNEAQESEPVAPKAYKYRLFDVSTSAEEPVTLVVRSEIDAVMKQPSGEDALVSIKTLNEFDSKAFGAGGAVDWRSKLDTQRGAIVATEMKNNSSKLARWTAQAILAGVDTMKIGFVSRVSPRDAQRHTILATATYKPREFASQMNLNLSNGWGIVRTIVDVCMKQPDGKYILVKDPNKSIMRIYGLGQESTEAL
jgi:translation initiation factor 3 subunit D